MLHLHILNTVNVLCAVGFMCLLLVPGWNIHLWCAEEILKIHCNPVYKMQDRILSPLFVRQRTSVPYSPLVWVGGPGWPCTLFLFSATWSRLCACHGLISVKYPRASGGADVHAENRDVGFGSRPACWALSATCRASSTVGSVGPADKVNWAASNPSEPVAGITSNGSSPLLFLPPFPKWFSDNFC